MNHLPFRRYCQESDINLFLTWLSVWEFHLSFLDSPCGSLFLLLDFHFQDCKVVVPMLYLMYFTCLLLYLSELIIMYNLFCTITSCLQPFMLYLRCFFWPVSSHVVCLLSISLSVPPHVMWQWKRLQFWLCLACVSNHNVLASVLM